MKTKKIKLPSPYISQNQKKNLLTLLKVFDRLSDYSPRPKLFEWASK